MNQKYVIAVMTCQMMAFELENIAILNIKCVDYRSAVWNISKSDAVNRLNDYNLDVNDSL